MSEEDQRRWDAKYATDTPVPAAEAPGLPAVFEPYEDMFPTSGHALELACGLGRTSVWLAARGLQVVGVDISPVALVRARDLARRAGVAERCRFEAADLDRGMPLGPPADVIICHRFRDSRLDQSILGRLAGDGLLAISSCSEVGSGPGRYRAAPGELNAAFASLRLIAEGERDGHAWLLARK